MARYAPNKMPAEVKRRYFELIRQGWKGAAAARAVGVSMSCGSVWFVDAGGVSYVETPISSRYLSQDDRIEIAAGLARGEPVEASRWLLESHGFQVFTETPAILTGSDGYMVIASREPGSSS